MKQTLFNMINYIRQTSGVGEGGPQSSRSVRVILSHQGKGVTHCDFYLYENY